MLFVVLSEIVLDKMGYGYDSRDFFLREDLKIYTWPSRPLALKMRPYNILVVGCSYTHAADISPENSYIWMLNEMVPCATFDNAALSGAGPLQCLHKMRLALNRRKYDAVIYMFIAHHTVRDLTRELADFTERKNSKDNPFVVSEWYELIPSPGSKKFDFVYHPATNIVWWGDDTLRLINFIKRFSFDAVYRFNNRQAHAMQKNYIDELPPSGNDLWIENKTKLLDRFHAALSTMRDTAETAGAKFGVVALQGLGDPFALEDLLPGEEYGEPIVALNAQYPIEFAPYYLHYNNDMCIYNHPNTGVYQYYAQKISSWLKAENFIPSNTKITPVPYRKIFTDNLNEENYKEPDHYVSPYVGCDDIPLKLRIDLANLQELIRSKNLGSKNKQLYDFFESNSEVFTNKLVPVQDIASFLNDFCQRMSAEGFSTPEIDVLAKQFSSIIHDPDDIGDYLELCAHRLQLYSALWKEEFELKPCDQLGITSIYQANRQILLCSEVMVRPISRIKLSLHMQKALKSLNDIGPNMHRYKWAEACKKCLHTALQRLENTSDNELLNCIGKYDGSYVENDTAFDDKIFSNGVKLTYDCYHQVPQTIKEVNIVRDGSGKKAHSGSVVTIRYSCEMPDYNIKVDTGKRPWLRYPLLCGYMTPDIELGICGMRAGEKRLVRTFGGNICKLELLDIE